MIGSNIFNIFHILGIIGVSALVTPLAVGEAIIRSDLWWMLGTSLLLLPILRLNARIMRWEGVVLLATYLAYPALLLAG